MNLSVAELRLLIAECQQYPEKLNEWEVKFLASLRRNGSVALTYRQLNKLADIAKKVGVVL